MTLRRFRLDGRAPSFSMPTARASDLIAEENVPAAGARWVGWGGWVGMCSGGVFWWHCGGWGGREVEVMISNNLSGSLFAAVPLITLLAST